MAESSVVVVVPSVNNSFKLASATNFVGAIGQDPTLDIVRGVAVACRLGGALEDFLDLVEPQEERVPDRLQTRHP